MAEHAPRCVTAVTVCAVHGEILRRRGDEVVTEEPLEIRVRYGPLGARRHLTIAVTMRTPGHDDELAVGLLYAERVIMRAGDMVERASLGDGRHDGRDGNGIRVELHPDVVFDPERVRRNLFSSSSCGVCGRVAIEALSRERIPEPDWRTPRVTPTMIRGLPANLRSRQELFDRTGGVHAAGLFDAAGAFIAVREDIGRHNAVDKLIGAQVIGGRMPLIDTILAVSGRTSYEILQKSVVAGIPVVVAVGAPSSLAVDIAREFGITLVGFARNDRFNVYAGEQRIAIE